MSNVIDNGQFLGQITSAASHAARYLPEPASKGVGIFRDVMEVVSSAADTVVGGVDNVATGDFAELIQLQIEAQQEMQTTTMVSNIEKSKHESKMSAIRNIRVS